MVLRFGARLRFLAPARVILRPRVVFRLRAGFWSGTVFCLRVDFFAFVERPVLLAVVLRFPTDRARGLRFVVLRAFVDFIFLVLADRERFLDADRLRLTAGDFLVAGDFWRFRVWRVNNSGEFSDDSDENTVVCTSAIFLDCSFK